MRGRFIGFALFLVASCAFGLSTGDLNRVVDLSTTLQSLSQATADGQPLPAGGRYVILTGNVSSISIIDQKKASFIAEIELVDGEWSGLEAVKLFRCFVRLAGPEFSTRIPARSGGAPAPDLIVPNGQVLVIGTIEGTRTLPDGSVVAVIDGAYIRNL